MPIIRHKKNTAIKIFATDSTGILIPISISNGKTVAEVKKRIEKKRGRKMKFNNLQNNKLMRSDQDDLGHFSEEEEEEEDGEEAEKERRAYVKNIKLEHVKDSSSENIVKLVIPTRGRESSKADTEVLEDFHAIMEGIKTENMEMDDEMNEGSKDEEIESFKMKPIILSRNYQVPILEQGLQFSEVLLESNNHTSIALLCRLCATRCEDMIFIFSPNEEYKNIMEMIKNCLPIMVSDTDTLPKQVCRWCIEKLELCHKFRKTVAEAEKQLIMLDEKISEDLKNGENCNQNSPLFEEAKETINAGEELGSDKETSDKEDQEYLPPKWRTFVIGKSAKILCEKNRSSPELKIEKNDKTNPGEEKQSEEQISDDELYRPPKTRSGRSFNSVKNLEETNNEVSVEKAINDHTYATQSADYNMIRCRVCGIYFDTAKSCYLHSSIHGSKKYHPCSICNKSFKNEKAYCRHSVEHTGGESLANKVSTHICLLCKKIFITKDRLNFHSTFHNPKTKSCYCEKCDKPMESESDLYEHMVKTHRRRVDHSCKICGKLFRSQLELSAHEGNLTPKDSNRKSRRFQCPKCKSKFYSADKVDLHRQHYCRNTYKFTCSYCARSFSRKWTLSNHIKLHTGEISYICKFCGRNYETKRSRDRHEMVHANGGKFKCKLCEKDFGSFLQLKQHENVHSKYAEFLTPNVAFKMDSDNNTKMEKRFQCDICPKYFLGPSTLQIHKRTQHDPNW